MKRKNSNRLLILPTDDYDLQRRLATMQARGLPLDRPARYHIKSGRVNFWPSTGTITIDTVGRVGAEGIEAFMKVAETDRNRNVRSLFSREASSDVSQPARSGPRALITAGPNVASPWKPKS